MHNFSLIFWKFEYFHGVKKKVLFHAFETFHKILLFCSINFPLKFSLLFASFTLALYYCGHKIIDTYGELIILQFYLHYMRILVRFSELLGFIVPYMVLWMKCWRISQ